MHPDTIPSMVEALSGDYLEQVEDRLNAALRIVPSPWVPLCETKAGIGGQSFIRGGDPERDHEIYLSLNLEGEQIPRGPDERLDDVVEFLGHAAGDIEQLLAEVRRLRGG